MTQAATLTLLNTSILTSYGAFTYEPLTLERARALVREGAARGGAVRSAIGHQATAELLTRLLDFPVAANRLEFRQAVNETALVFKLKGRVPEGRVLSIAELEAVKPVAVSRGSRQQLLPTAYCPLATPPVSHWRRQDGGGGSRLIRQRAPTDYWLLTTYYSARCAIGELIRVDVLAKV